jgi:hypothetical protein
VPAVVVSGYARPRSVTNVVHDHTSILATIQAKWNLPTMTYRDANAATMLDFLDSRVTLPDPPALAAPSDLQSSESSCDSTALKFTVHPGRPPVRQRLLVNFGVSRARHSLVIGLRTTRGAFTGLTVRLLHHGKAVATGHVRRVGTAPHQVVLRGAHGHSLARGRYELVVRRGHRVLARRAVVIR